MKDLTKVMKHFKRKMRWMERQKISKVQVMIKRVAKEMVLNDDMNNDKLCIQYILQFKSDSKLWGEDHERMARKVSMNKQAS